MPKHEKPSGLRKMKGAWYAPYSPPGGSTKVFWTYAGKTRREAEACVKAQALSTRAPALPPDVKQRIWEALATFRKSESAAFNKDSRIAFYTDLPHRFSGKNVHNPTREMLDCCGLRHDFISTEQILAGELASFQVLFCPGGFGYFPSQKMRRRLREFVSGGGGYIGFCAGAFLPLKGFADLCESTFAYFREQGFPDVLLNQKDPIATGIESTARPVCYALYAPPRKQRKCMIRIKMHRGNGPLLIASGRDRAVGYFDSTEGYSPIIRATCGEGRVVSFSTHPDCAMAKLLAATNEENVVANLKLFKNAVLYCARITKPRRAPRKKPSKA